MRRLLLALLVSLTLAPDPAVAAGRYDPGLRFRSITTTHFVIHYHQGEETLALRLAAIVEEVHRELGTRLRHVPRGRTHVVLVDQTDESNGWATPVPYNLIEVTAAPPPGASVIGNTSDWLRLVFTHEYAHILHLDRSRGWARAARAVFGRAPFAFPNLTLPLWQIEGLATYEESRGGEGRVPAGDFHTVVRHPARLGRFEPLDRVNGGLADWPAGWGWYAYGAYFHDYLARRFGEERMVDLSDRTAGRLPYVTSGAFEGVFGVSLGQLWRDFRAEQAAPGPPHDDGGPERLTQHGYLTDTPRYDVDGTLVYARRDAHDFPALMRLGEDGRSERLVSRAGGHAIAPARGGLYFDQLEVHGVVGLVSDLYYWDRRTGDVTRLSHGARLAEPDVSPDGRRLAAIQVRDGARRLVIGDLSALEPSGPHEHWMIVGDGASVFASPRWSPDGAVIVAERRRLGGPSELVLVDPSGGGVRVVASSARGRNVTPAWTPDGAAVIFASDRDGGPFQLYRLRLDDDGRVRSTERLTNVFGGARHAAVAPDGRSVVYVGYTLDGHDLFRTALDGGGVRVTSPVAAVATASDPAPGDPPASIAYRPWSTLAPRTWLPVVFTDNDEWRAGAVVGGTDALGYHAWAATATWSVARRAELDPVAPGNRPDLVLSYAYDRWRPTLFGQFADETTPLLVGTERRPVALRERRSEVGVYVPFRRVRRSQVLLASYSLERATLTGPTDEGHIRRGALRVGWALDSARRYGHSISRVDGISAGVTSELSRTAFGADGDATFTRADLRAYLPAWPRHGVVALRASGALSRGDPVSRRVARLGGHEGDGSVLSFSEDATSLLRGFPANTFLGTRVALVNTEYRVPLASVQRGIGTIPLFLRSLHATAFLDAGHAWDGPFRWGDRKWAWGGEVALDTIVGYALPLTVSGGVAWGRDGAATVADTRRVYVRLGHGF